MSDEEVRQIAYDLRRLFELGEIIEQALSTIQHYIQVDDVLRDLSVELPQHLERQDKILLAILDRLDNTKPDRMARKVTAELRSEIYDNRKRSLMRQIKQLYDNINFLEEQSVDYGSNVPLHITNEIIKNKEILSDLEDEFDYYRNQAD